MLFKIDIFKNFSNFTGKHMFGCHFKKVAGLKACSLFRKRLQHRCFPVGFAKFLRTIFFTEHLRWLLLSQVKQNPRPIIKKTYNYSKVDKKVWQAWIVWLNNINWPTPDFVLFLIPITLPSLFPWFYLNMLSNSKKRSSRPEVLCKKRCS